MLCRTNIIPQQGHVAIFVIQEDKEKSKQRPYQLLEKQELFVQSQWPMVWIHPHPLTLCNGRSQRTQAAN